VVHATQEEEEEVTLSGCYHFIPSAFTGSQPAPNRLQLQVDSAGGRGVVVFAVKH